MKISSCLQRRWAADGLTTVTVYLASSEATVNPSSQLSEQSAEGTGQMYWSCSHVVYGCLMVVLSLF